MDTERMIRQLRRTAKKHQNDVLHTFDTNISAMCTDVANRLEELNQSNNEIRNKAIDDFVQEIRKAYDSMKSIPSVEIATANTIALGIAEKLKDGGTDA